jgi:hypothetical protein
MERGRNPGVTWGDGGDTLKDEEDADVLASEEEEEKVGNEAEFWSGDWGDTGAENGCWGRKKDVLGEEKRRLGLTLYC